MQRWLYSIGITLYWAFGWVYSLLNKKAADWYNGNKNLRATNLPAKNKKRIWFHISSLGEYEQAKPVIKRLYRDFEIVLTFFSPSGYGHKSVREFTGHVFYLGKDSKQVAKANLKNIDPDIFVLVKYDFWINHLLALHKAGVKSIVISALFRPNQVFFKPYGGLFRKGLKTLNHFFLQNEESAQLLKSIGITNTTVNGDTRVDSVLENVPEALDKLPKTINEFAHANKCLVVGSSYAVEEKLIAANLGGCLKEWKIIIAPHNIDNKHLGDIEELFGNKAAFLSKNDSDPLKTQVLIIDQVGLLKYLYAVAHVAFVGGGFGKTVHNTLEPAAFGIPILFGPNFKKFPEAIEMVKMGGAFSLATSINFSHVITHLAVEAKYIKSCERTRAIIEKNQGATKKVLLELKQALGE